MDLDWQNGLHQLKDRGLHLLQTEKWADCRFLVGSSNQRLIAAHKLFLAIASPVFECMFFGNLADKSDPIVIPDVQPEAFYSMLEYIYSDRITITTFDKACELCYVAKKYMLPHVVEQCTHFLWADLSAKNACRAYEFARLFDEPRLMQSSMEIIAANTREVLADPSFVDVEPSTLMAILDQPKLNIDSELDLFNALMRYATERGMFKHDDVDINNKLNKSAEATAAVAEYHGEQQSVVEVDVESLSNHHADVNAMVEIKMEADVSDMLNNYEENANNAIDDVVVLDSDGSSAEAPDDDDDAAVGSAGVSASNILHAKQCCEAILQQAVKKIRFLTLTPQQFAEGPARSKLLKQHEALAILIKISSPAINDCPMPEGFCSSRCYRNFYEPRNLRDLSSYRHSVASHASNTSGIVLIDVQQHHQEQLGSGSDNELVAPSSSTTVATLNQPPPPASNLNRISESNLLTNDTRRLYCVRTINRQFDYRNTSVTDCGLTFQVDTNIWILGVQVPTQVLCGELMNSAGFSERYREILYAHIQDNQDTRLTYTHYISQARYDSLLEISFDRPVYIYRNQIYKIFVVFNKVGWYPIYTCVPDVSCNRVKFMFNVGNPNESVRDGLIRAILFTTPQEQSRSNIIE